VELRVGVRSVLDEVTLIGLPPQPEGLTLRLATRLFVVALHAVSIGGWFFLGVAEDDLRNRPAVPLAEGATLARVE
jgi:hypothetical protein